MESDDKLHPVEIVQGWHFCWDWDGLLVGPGMGELQTCTCHPKPPGYQPPPPNIPDGTDIFRTS